MTEARDDDPPEADPEVLAIMSDPSLNAVEKARNKQALINSRVLLALEESDQDEQV
jgi:hypothetical protein